MKDGLKKWGPTLGPVVLTLLAMTSPSVQSWIQHTLAPLFAHLLVCHPAVMTGLATLIVAIYHALPSPLQK